MLMNDPCKNCGTRPATTNWVGEGGILDDVHGMSQRWCDYCATRGQLVHCKKMARRIPILEKKLKSLALK